MGHSSVVSASDAELLALVGWMAARHFDPAVAVAAAESWTWIMTDQPQLRLPLLTEVRPVSPALLVTRPCCLDMVW